MSLVTIFVGISGFANISKKSLYCSDATIQSISDSIKLQNLTANNMSNAAVENLRMLSEISGSAKLTAYTSTSLLLICLTYLVGYLIFKFLTSPKFSKGNSNDKANALGFSIISSLIVFCFSFYSIHEFSLPLKNQVQEYKKTVSLKSMDAPKITDKNSMGHFLNYLMALHKNLSKLPVEYFKAGGELPIENQWLTFGWDEFHKVEFESVAVKAILERWQLEKEETTRALPQIKRLCRPSQFI